MRPVLWCLIIAAATFASSGCVAPEGATSSLDCPSDLDRYTAPDEAFYMCIAPGWDKREGLMGSVVALYPAAEVETTEFVRSVNVYTEPVPAHIGLDAYRDVAHDTLESLMNDYRVVEEGPATLGGTAAHHIVYTATQGRFTVLIQQVFVLHDETAYVWTYSMDDDMNTLEDPVVAAMRDSFTFI